MVETVSSVVALLLCAEFFCLGGSVFAHRESTKNVLRCIVIVLAIIAMTV